MCRSQNSLKTTKPHIWVFKVVQGHQCWYPLKAWQQFLLLQAARLNLAATVFMLDKPTVAGAITSTATTTTTTRVHLLSVCVCSYRRIRWQTTTGLGCTWPTWLIVTVSQCLVTSMRLSTVPFNASENPPLTETTSGTTTTTTTGQQLLLRDGVLVLSDTNEAMNYAVKCLGDFFYD